jgi:hypothetical protein
MIKAPPAQNFGKTSENREKWGRRSKVLRKITGIFIEKDVETG